ncbi:MULTISPECIES: hypothetical protein [Calothrix]|uniref:hypothetical protein n=1 Tax=Calothrix TaxID=1186 RepID=UPI001A7E32E8|nr:hypothetical protein [Calothrix parietina]
MAFDQARWRDQEQISSAINTARLSSKTLTRVCWGATALDGFPGLFAGGVPAG